jgi:hypothetical protein
VVSGGTDTDSSLEPGVCANTGELNRAGSKKNVKNCKDFR